jgi:aldehyde reductase
MAVEKLKLNNGYEMPIYGLGTMFVSSQNDNINQKYMKLTIYFKAREDIGIQAIKDAIDIGYRHFDTAHLYGNEKQVGDGIRAKIAEGVIKREDVFVVTKVSKSSHTKKSLSDRTLFKYFIYSLAVEYLS